MLWKKKAPDAGSVSAKLNDDMLGELRFDPKLDSWVGRLALDGREIELHIAIDGAEMAECFELTRQIVTSLSAFELKARSAASKEFLETYNDNWREFSVRRADGSFEDVSNPTLTEAQFEQRLIFDVVSIIGSDTVEFCYGDGELFSGHSIIVTSFDGTTFNDIHAALFG